MPLYGEAPGSMRDPDRGTRRRRSWRFDSPPRPARWRSGVSYPRTTGARLTIAKHAYVRSHAHRVEVTSPLATAPSRGARPYLERLSPRTIAQGQAAPAGVWSLRVPSSGLLRTVARRPWRVGTWQERCRADRRRGAHANCPGRCALRPLGRPRRTASSAARRPRGHARAARGWGLPRRVSRAQEGRTSRGPLAGGAAARRTARGHWPRGLRERSRRRRRRRRGRAPSRAGPTRAASAPRAPRP